MKPGLKPKIVTDEVDKKINLQDSAVPMADIDLRLIVFPYAHLLPNLTCK